MEILFSIALRTKQKEVEIGLLTPDSEFQQQINKFDRQELAKDILIAVQRQLAKASNGQIEEKPTSSSIIVP